jgi:hypothetical protein
MQEEGKPEAWIESAAEEVRITGRPGESLKPAARKDARFEATRKSIAGTAKGPGFLHLKSVSEHIRYHYSVPMAVIA